MTEQGKMDALCEIFEREDISPETELDSLQWDSMTMMSIMVRAKMAGKEIARSDLREMKTIGDVLKAM